MKWKRFAVAILGGLQLSLAAERESVTAEDAFWAFDDGRISYEELEDLLESIESGDAREACEEWEALGGDPCRKTLSERLSDWNFRGNARYALSIDSSGNVRNETATLKVGIRRFSGEVRGKSERRKNARVEHWKFLYEGSSFRNALGNVSAADLGSSIPLQKRTGNVSSAKLGNFQAGAFLLTDSSAGILASAKLPRAAKVSGMGNFSMEGFQNAFLRTNFPLADVQILYAKSWRTPLLFLSGKSGQEFPLRIRLRAYFHRNDSLPGVFKLPQRVESSKAFASTQIETRFRDWQIKLSARFSIPADSGKSREFAEAFVGKKNPAAIDFGLRANSVGDSLSATGILRSGIRLFSAESLFAEWRLSPDFYGERTLYEIRPGIRIQVEEEVSTQCLLILRGPQKKPLSLRNVTEMSFSQNLFGKSSLEWRANRLREMHLWRFGLSLGGKW